jgi:hypothetical protein
MQSKEAEKIRVRWRVEDDLQNTNELCGRKEVALDTYKSADCTSGRVSM